MTQPIAILGGTFDPVHYGHLRFADEVRHALGLADVRLVPAGDPPHRGGPEANAAHRLAMLREGVAGFPGLLVDGREVARGGKSYTVLTLEELRREHPGAPLLLLVGADAFHGFPTWHRWRELFALAHVVVVPRPGTPLAQGMPPELAVEWNARRTVDRNVLFSTPAGAIYEQPIAPQPISATAIRASLKNGAAGRRDVIGLLPPAVLAYIDQHALYSTAPDAT